MTHDIEMMKVAALGLCSLAFAGCATQYAYDFHLTDPGVHPAVKMRGAENAEDQGRLRGNTGRRGRCRNPGGDHQQRQRSLQLEWAETTLTRSNGTVTSLRPDVSLGWIQPHATVATRLVAIALPRSAANYRD